MAEPRKDGSAPGPLDDVRVLEIAQGMAGPMAGMVLADYGADVIKVEPPGGDWARRFPGFAMWNRGKRSITADLSDGGEVEAVRSLVSGADVVISALRGGSTGHQALRRMMQPRPDGLILCEISTSGSYEVPGLGFGYEHVTAAALGRMQDLDNLSGAVPGVGDGRPVFSYAPVGSYGAAQLALQAVLGALWRRSRTGRGAVVRTSLLQGMSAAVMRFPFAREEGRDEVLRRDRASNLRVKGIGLTFLTAECADGRYIQMCARQDHHFRNWLNVLGLGHILEDPRFARAPLELQSLEDVDYLEKLLRESMRQRTQAEWMDIFIHEADVGGDPFLTSEEFLRHPQLEANNRLVTVEDPELGSVLELGPIALIRDLDLPMPACAPHNPSGSGQVNWQRSRSDRTELSSETLKPEHSYQPDRLPFEGVTIIELAYYLAAPLGATLLAELGARVIKVEPPQGDSYRRAGVEFIHMVHGKESISLDLRNDKAREVLHRLIRGADALLTNFRPGVPERLGFGYDEVHALNPHLVYLYAGSYGSKGEQAHRAAFHSTPNALCGGGIRQAGEGNPPVDDSYPDPCSGLGVGTALALGLMAREATGTGCYLESSMLVSTGYALSNDLVAFDGASTPLVDGGQYGLGPLYRLYECADGWLFLGICQEKEWLALAECLGDLGEIKTTVGWPGLAESRGELEPLLEAKFRSRPARAWVDELNVAGVPVAIADGAALEPTLHRVGFLTPSGHPSVGPYWRMGPRMDIDGVAPDRRPATGVGEFSEQILTELNYSSEEIAALIADGIVYSGPSERS